MAARTVRDSAGRMWTCTSSDTDQAADESTQGRDVMVGCTTPAVDGPVALKVGWQWETMADAGLARMINLASPVPKR